MSEGNNIAFRSRNDSGEQVSGEEGRHEVKEAIILVKDARLFSAADRALWHLDRLASHPIQPRSTSPAWNSSSSTSPLPPPTPPPASFDLGNDLTLIDVNVVHKRSDPTTAAVLAASRGTKRQRNPARSVPSWTGGGGESYDAEGRPSTPRQPRLGESTGGSFGGGGGNATVTSAAGMVGRARAGAGLRVTPQSELWFAHRKYRVVVCIDLSASMITERWWGMPIHFVVDATMKFLKGLVAPLTSVKQSGSPENVAEEVYVSVVAYAAEVDAVWSLKQGYLLRGGTEESSPSLVQLRQLLSKLIVRVENRLVADRKRAEDRQKNALSSSDEGSPRGVQFSPTAAVTATHAHAQTPTMHARPSSVREREAKARDSQRRQRQSQRQPHYQRQYPPYPPGGFSSSSPPSHSPSSTPKKRNKKTQLEGMSEAVELALEFLPLDAAPMALIVTDGVVGYPAPMEYDGLPMRLCRKDVSVSCLLLDRIGASTLGKIGVSASGKAGGCETDRRGADYQPHDGNYAMTRKFRVPDLNGLAHLASVSGGCFFTLETLHAMTDGDARGSVSAAGAGDGASPGSRLGSGRKVVDEVHGGGVSSADYARKGGPLGVGPSLALCQPERPLNPSVFQRRMMFRTSPLSVEMTRNSLLRHNPALVGRIPIPAPLTPVSGGLGVLGAPASSLGGAFSGGGGFSGIGAGRASGTGTSSAGTSPDERAGMLQAIVSAASHVVGPVVGEIDAATRQTLARKRQATWKMNGTSPLRVFAMRCSEGFRAVHLELRGWDGYWHGSPRRVPKARQGGGVAATPIGARAVPSGRSAASSAAGNAAAAGGESSTFNEPPSEELRSGTSSSEQRPESPGVAGSNRIGNGKRTSSRVSTGSGGGGGGGGGAAFGDGRGLELKARFSLAWRRDVKVDYTYTFKSKHTTLSSPGKADVSVDLVLPVRLLLELDKSESDRSMQSGDKDAGAGRLLRFLTTLKKVDEMLPMIEKELHSLPPRGQELDPRSSDRCQLLGRMKVSDWPLFFNTDHVEVIFRSIATNENPGDATSDLYPSTGGSAPTSPSATAAATNAAVMRSWGAGGIAAAAASAFAGDITGAKGGEVFGPTRSTDASEIALVDDVVRVRSGSSNGAAQGRGHVQGVRNEEALKLLHDVCQGWCTWSWPRLFLKVLSSDEPSPSERGAEAMGDGVKSARASGRRERAFVLAKVKWMTASLAVVHVGCFGMGSARRAEVMKDLRQKIWSAGAFVATAQTQGDDAAVEKKAREGGWTVDVPGDEARNVAGDAAAAGGGGGRGESVKGADSTTASSRQDQLCPVHEDLQMPQSSSSDGVGVGGSGSGSNGNRNSDAASGPSGSWSRLSPQQEAFSDTFTLKECLVHKVNTGLSGMESKIFFQLARPRSRHATASAAIANKNAFSSRVSWGKGAPYPTFSGDDPLEPGGPEGGQRVVRPTAAAEGSSSGEGSSALPDLKHVTSYLRRRRWLWSFPSAECSNDAEERSGIGGGGGSGGWFSPESWDKYLQRMINSLSRSRRADGFVLVERLEKEAFMVKGVRIMLGVVPTEDGGSTGSEREGKKNSDSVRGGAGRGRDGAASVRGAGASKGWERRGFQGPIRPMRIILQYRVFEAGPGKIGTELLMEPQHGHFRVERRQAKGASSKDGSGGGGGGGFFWMSDEELFMHLIRYLGAADLRILSSFNSFVHLVNLCKSAAMPAAVTGSERSRNSTNMLRVGAGGAGAGFDVGNIRGGGLGSGGSGCSGGGVAVAPSLRRPEGEDGDGVLSETQVPFSLVNLVVHADQRRSPLRTFHFADALPSPPPPPPTLSISRSRRSGGGCEDRTAGKGREARQREMAEERREEMPEEEKNASTSRCCATCGNRPVIIIEDSNGSGGGDGGGGGGASGVTDGDGVDEDDEANKQLHALLQKVLEETKIPVPWAISKEDLIPPAASLTPEHRQAPTSRFANRMRHTAAAPTFPAAPASASEEPSTLVGPTGALPTGLADGGRWFARTVGDGAILLTFLPAWEAWHAEVAQRVSHRRQTRSSAAANEGEGEEKGEIDYSLGLFLFLVRMGNFGLPIEPQTAVLRGVRKILLEHIPVSYHREMAFKPAQRIGWGDDPRGGPVGTMARSYQGLIALAHRQAFFQVAYNSLRAGRALCYDDLAFALSGTAESLREVDITKLRRIALDGSSSRSVSNNDNNDSSDDVDDEAETLARQAAQEAFDVEFRDILSRFLRPVPGTSYYIYWRRDDHEEERATRQLGSPTESSSASMSTYVSANGGGSGGSRSPLDPRELGRISSLGDRCLRRGSLMLTDAFASDPAVTTATVSLRELPLFVRFKCAHESSSSSSTNAVVATVTSGAAAGAASAREAKGAGERGRGEDDGSKRERNSVAVDTRHSLSRALKAFPSVEIVPWWVDELAAEEAESSRHSVGGRGGSGGSERSKGLKSHLLIFTTMCPKKAWSRAVLGGEGRASNISSNTSGPIGGSKGISGGGGGVVGLDSARTSSVPGSGAHLSQTPTPTHFGKYSRPRTLSAGDLTGLHGVGAVETANHPALERLIEALEAHTKKAYASEVLRCLLRRKPVTVSTLQSVRRCLRPLPLSEVTRFLVPLEFVVDIVDRDVEKQHRRDSPTEEAHLRKTKSIQTARELFDLELRRGAYPSLRRGQQQQQQQQQQPTASVAPSDQADPASGLFFLVVDESRLRGNVQASQPSGGGGRGGNNLTVVSPSTGMHLPYPWIGVGTHGEKESRAEKDAEAVVDAAVPAVAVATHGHGGSGVEESAAEGKGSLDVLQQSRGVDPGVVREDPSDGARVDGTDCVDNHKYEQEHGQDDSKYMVPYWAIMRVGDVARDPDDDADPWPLLGVSSGVSDRVSGKASRGLSKHPLYQQQQQEQQQQQRRRQQQPPRKTSSRMPTPPTGYSIVIIHAKVSVHHPRGSAVVANKDAVVEGITKGLKARARKVNQLMLLKSLIESKIANEVLIPPDTVPAPPPPPLKEPPSIMTRRSPPDRPSRAGSSGNVLSSSRSSTLIPSPIDTIGVVSKTVGGSGALGAAEQGLRPRKAPHFSPPPAQSPSLSTRNSAGAFLARRSSDVGWRVSPAEEPSNFVARSRSISNSSGSNRSSGSMLLLKAPPPTASPGSSQPEVLGGGSSHRPSRLVMSGSRFDVHGSSSRSTNSAVADAELQGQASAATQSARGTPARQDRPRTLGERFRVGELSCECKYSRRFALNHRLRGDKVQNVLKNLDSKTLAHAKVPGIGQLYVYPDMQRNIFYMTLSGVCKDREGGELHDPSRWDAIELKVYGVEEVGEDFRISLDCRIERALSQQAWQALAQVLQTRSDSKVTPADIEFIRTGPNEMPEPAKESGVGSPKIGSSGSRHGRKPSFSSVASDRSLGDSRFMRAFGSGSGDRGDSGARAEGSSSAMGEALPGHARAWFALSGDSVVDSYLLLMYLRQVLCADDLKHVLHCAPERSPQQQQTQQQQQQHQPQSPQEKHHMHSPPSKSGVQPPRQMDVTLKGRHRRRSTASSTEALAAAFGPIGDVSGAASVGGGRRRRREARESPPLAREDAGGNPRSATPPPLLTGTEIGDDDAMEPPRPALSRGLSSDAILTPSPRRRSNEATPPTDWSSSADVVSNRVANTAVAAGLLATSKGWEGVGLVRGLRHPWARRGSLGKDIASAPQQANAFGEMARVASPTRPKTAAGVTAAATAAQAARGAIALAGAGEPPQRDGARGKNDKEGDPDQTAAGAAVAVATVEDLDDEKNTGSRRDANEGTAVGSTTTLEPRRYPIAEASLNLGDDVARVVGVQGGEETEGLNENSKECGGGGAGGPTSEGLEEEVAVDPANLTFFYSSFQRSLQRGDSAARRMSAKVGEGIAFVKLWPLNPKTGARSSSIRTGFPAPSLDEMASRLSSGGPGIDIEILLGEDGVAAVAKAEAEARAAVAEASEPKEAKAKAGEAKVVGADEIARTEAGVSTVEGKAVQVAPDPLAISSMEEDGAIAQGADVTMTPVVNVAPCEVDVTSGAGVDLPKAKGGSDLSSAPRWLALEVEMFACGSINVPYMMELIKVCFEQALTEYIVERLLLRDRVGLCNEKLAIHTRAPGVEDGLEERGELTSPRQASNSMSFVTSAAATLPPQPAGRAAKSAGARGEGRGGASTTIRHRIPRTVKRMCFMLSRLTDKAAGGTSPVTQRVESTEIIPWWAMMAVVQDLTQAICHRQPSFFKSTTALHFNKSRNACSCCPNSAILGDFVHTRPGNVNSDGDPGTIVVLLGLELDGAPKTHVREDLEEAFRSAGVGGNSNGVGSASGGGTGGASQSNRPPSSFALDPPHLQQHQQRRALFPTASGPSLGPGGGGSGGVADSRACSSVSEWQQQVRRRGMFCVISMSSARQSLTTYNFEHRLFDESRAAFASSLTWARYQRAALENILSQNSGRWARALTTVHPVLPSVLRIVSTTLPSASSILAPSMNTTSSSTSSSQELLSGGNPVTPVAADTVRRGMGEGGGGEGSSSDPYRGPLFLTEESVRILAMNPAGPSSLVLRSLVSCVAATSTPHHHQQQQQQQHQQQQYHHPSARPGSPNPPTAAPRSLKTPTFSPRLMQHHRQVMRNRFQKMGAGRPPAAPKPAVAVDEWVSSGLGSGSVSHKRAGGSSSDLLAWSTTASTGSISGTASDLDALSADGGSTGSKGFKTVNVGLMTSGRGLSTPHAAGSGVGGGGSQQQQQSGKTAAQLQEEANVFAARLADISASAWCRYKRELRAGSRHLVDASVTTRPLARAAATGLTPNTMGSVGVSSHLPFGFAVPQQSSGVAGGSNHSDRNFPFASPLQAKFVCRARLVELDREEKIKRRRRWDAVKTWTWGYDTQCRLDAAQGEEATGDDGKQAGAAAEAADAENSSEGRVTKDMTGEVKSSGAVGSSAAGARPIVADVAMPAQSEGRRSPRKSPGSAPGERSPQPVEGAVAVASDERRGESRGFPRAKTAPTGLVVSAQGVSPSPGWNAAAVSSEALESKKHLQLRSAASLPVIPGAVGASAGRDVNLATEVLATAAEKDEDDENDESVDWLRDVWSQCRIQAVKTYPLLLPMPLPALTVSSVRDGRGKDNRNGDGDGIVDDENCDEDGGFGRALDAERLSRSHPPSGSVNVAGAWGGSYSGEGVGRGGMGIWDAFNPLARRQFGYGAASSTVGEFNPTYSSPKTCQPLSSTQNNDGGAGPFWNRRGTPDLSGHSASASAGFSVSGIGFLHRDRKQASSETEDLEGSRSRSASSGLGRDSFDGSLVGGEENFDRTASLIARSLPHGNATALAAGMATRGSASRFDSGRTVYGEDADRGEFIQARSMSLAEVERDDPRGFDPRACAPMRWQSARSGSIKEGTTAAAAAAAAKQAAGARTPECHELDQNSGTLEKEAAERTVGYAVTLAWRFVNAYSAYLVENLDFKPISRGNEAAVETGLECDPWVVTARLGEAEATATPFSRSNVDATRCWETSTDGVEGGSSGRGSRKVERRGSGESRSGADVICARRLLRLGMDLSNTVALVEVTVTVEREKIKATAAATVAAATANLSRNHDMPMSEASPTFEGQTEQGYPRIAAEGMLASLKLWTLDVEEPKEGWGAEGPPGGVCDDSVEGGAFSWWAKLPTLDSFRWCMDPDDFVRGRCLPDELPVELRRLIVALRLQRSLDDFVLGQVEHALACTPPEDCARQTPDEQLNNLFAQNAYAILWHAATKGTASAAAAMGARQQYRKPTAAVTRHVISIELDTDDQDPLFNDPRPGPSPTAVDVVAAIDTMTAAVEPPASAWSRTIRAPIPLRNRAAMHEAIPSDFLLRPASGVGSVTSREEEEVGGNPAGSSCVAGSSSLLWNLLQHSEAYGLTPQPVTSGMPAMKGVIMAKRRGGGGGGSRSGCRGDDAVGTLSANAYHVEDEDEEFPACTFLLTSPDGDQGIELPRGQRGGSAATVASGRRLDILLYVIPSSTTNICRSWDGRDTANSTRPTGICCGGGSWAAELRSEEPSTRPDPQEVTEQAKKLVEGTLRLALAHPRRNRVWSLFQSVMAIALKQSPSVEVSRTPRSPAGSSARHRVTDRSSRAPSSAQSHDTGSGCASYGFGEEMPKVDKSDLRRLLELSVVTPLGVADPALSSLLDPKHGVDWAGWFQHLVDSPLMCTLVVKDDDVPQGKTPALTTEAAAAVAGSNPGKSFYGSVVAGARSDGSGAVVVRSARRTLVMMPKKSLEHERWDIPADSRGRGGGSEERHDTEFAGGKKEAEGPRVAWQNTGRAAVSTGGSVADERGPLEAVSLLVCVSLEKETKTVEVDVVQKMYSPMLTGAERAALSDVVKDMLAWCTRDILRGTDHAHSVSD